MVAGVAGFLGSHLADSLIASGHNVFGLDNLSTGSISNIEHLANSDHFEFIQTNISKTLPAGLNNIQMIYHMASPASPPRYMDLPLETMEVNTQGTQNLLELARKENARILFASTSEIYGDPFVHPQPESYWGNVNPIGPRSVYDEAKRFGETLMALYHRQGWANTVIIRIFNTYGPRLDPNDGRVVSSFIRDALRGKPLPIFGDGSQTRSFCYVSDLISGIRLAAESTHSGPINLGNTTENTLLELAQIISELFEIKLELSYSELPEDDPKQRQPDISLAQHILGWEPKVALRDGLLETINWMRAQPLN